MSKKKIIAFVSDAVYPYNKGGKETRLHEISTRLAVEGWDVHIFCMKWWKGDKDRVEEGVHIHAISPYYPLYSGNRRSMKEGILFGLSCFHLLRYDFDVIDVDHMPFFPLFSIKVVCMLKRKKMFATWHEVWGMNYWREYLGRVKGTIAGVIELASVKTPDGIIAVSQMTADRLRGTLGYKNDLYIVPNGIDLNTITAAVKSKIESEVLFAGRLLSHKNVDVLIESIELLKNDVKKIKLVIVGEGPEKEPLKALVNKLHLEKHVEFLPFQPKVEDLYGLMKSSKVFVLPSAREGFGLSVLEANAAGIPVVTIDHADNAAKDLITENNGEVVKLSKENLADAIKRNLKKVRSSGVFSKNYSWKKIATDLSKIYEASLYS